jgi:hypothetical protein
MNYTTVSLVELRTGLEDVARDAQSTFGRLNARQLNWRPHSTQWSVAQCFEHLLMANRLMFEASERALDKSVPRTIWQRLPGTPRLFGPMLVRSQTPEGARKFKAMPAAQPSTSNVASDIIERFVEQHRDAVERVRALDEREAARAIMVSPFVTFITYSVLDGWRLLFAHDRRHVEQARRVTRAPGFP